MTSSAALLTLSDGLLLEWVVRFVLVFTRVGALLMATPFLRSTGIPAQVRLILALTLSAMVTPHAMINEVPDPLSISMLTVLAQEFTIGLAMGFFVQLVFASLTMAGEAISMSMGLGFSTMIDPQNGVPVPVLSQFLVLMGTMLLLVLDTHLWLIELLGLSFTALPVGSASLGVHAATAIMDWATHMYGAAILIALPLLTAVLIINFALGIVTRAAPQLNIFAVGFPFLVLLGLILLSVTLDSQFQTMEDLVDHSLTAAEQMLMTSQQATP